MIPDPVGMTSHTGAKSLLVYIENLLRSINDSRALDMLNYCDNCKQAISMEHFTKVSVRFN